MRSLAIATVPLLLVPLLLAACGGGKETGALKVGVILPMTGPQSTYGEESWNGMQLAREDLEQQEFHWELMLKDEKSEKQQAGNQAKLLIENERRQRPPRLRRLLQHPADLPGVAKECGRAAASRRPRRTTS